MKLIFYISLIHSFTFSHASSVQSLSQLDLVDHYLDMLTQRQTSCTRLAISDMLPNCEHLHENQETLHLKHAIELSICEFQTADIDYPEVCTSSSLQVCSRTLETKPQWWTTFSNNYRAIGQICTGYRLEHAKDERLKDFEEYLRAQKEMVEYLNQAIRDRTHDNGYLQQVYWEFITELERKSNQNKEILVQNRNDLIQMSGLVESLKSQLVEIVDEYSQFQANSQTQMTQFSENLAGLETNTLTRQKQVSTDLETQLLNWVTTIQLAHSRSVQLYQIVTKSKEISSDLLNDTEQSAILAKTAKDAQEVVVGNAINVLNTMRYVCQFIRPFLWIITIAISGGFIRRYLILLILFLTALGYYRPAMGLIACHTAMRLIVYSTTNCGLINKRKKPNYLESVKYPEYRSKKKISLY